MALADARTNRLQWVHEDDPRWDADRERVFATVPDDVFPTVARRPGERLSSDWWRVERDGRVVGYGWLDDVWGDAEILLAVEEPARGSGVGAFVVDRLEEEAAARGLNYVLNVVRETHPERAAVAAWFQRQGFAATEDGRLRKHVGTREQDVVRQRDGRSGTGRPAAADAARQERYVAERDRAAGRSHEGAEPSQAQPLGPGHEESGGYVDVEEHRF
jgi:N-acetylglutamate synthase-like GNAT family acetyltransferase